MVDLARSVGQAIRAWRDEMKLTQEQVAAMIGVEAATVHRWECGRHLPSKWHLGALNAALGMEVVLRVQAKPQHPLMADRG